MTRWFARMAGIAVVWTGGWYLVFAAGQAGGWVRLAAAFIVTVLAIVVLRLMLADLERAERS